METTAVLLLPVAAFFFFSFNSFGFAVDLFERDDLDFVAIPNVLRSVQAKSMSVQTRFGWSPESLTFPAQRPVID
jgi:hypothetical protein